MKHSRKPAKPPARMQNIQGARKREHLLKVAGRVFAEKGFDGTGLRDISRASGVFSSALMYHFGNKAGLFAETLRHHILENTHFPRLFDPMIKADPAKPQAVADAVHAAVRGFMLVCHGPGRAPALGKLLIRLLTEARPELRRQVLHSESAGMDAVFTVFAKVNPRLTEADAFSWAQLLWAQIFHTITAKQMLLDEIGGGKTLKEYPKPFFDEMVWRIARHNCLVIGLPEPSRA
jgi:AcrR family transcriptional regulator